MSRPAALLLVIFFAQIAYSLDQACLSVFKSKPIFSLYFHMEDFIAGDELPLSIADVDHEKVERIWRIFTPMLVENHGVSLEDVERSLAFIQKARGKVDALLDEQCSVYVHTDQTYLKLPVLFTKSGHIYLLLDQLDRKRPKGGFKQFSRGIELDTERVVAHLASFPKNKAEQFTLRELSVLEAVKGSMVAPDLWDWEIYPAIVDGTMVPTYAFQTELFHEDLRSASRHIISEQTYALLLRQALEALLNLHEKGYIHGDVKPGNFLVNEDLSRLVLIDFGLSHAVGSSQFGMSLEGTKGFLAPELCVNFYEDGRAYVTESEAKKAEIFSLGMSFLELLKGPKYPLYVAIRSFNRMILGKGTKVKLDPDAFYSSLGQLSVIYREAVRGEEPGTLSSLLLELVNIEADLRPDLVARRWFGGNCTAGSSKNFLGGATLRFRSGQAFPSSPEPPSPFLPQTAHGFPYFCKL
ncbi:MAG: protein kinase family protein [Deltaproteobacteria bacterium]|nr:protein kinase family protein [Deltaproteobacteria bacterium]